MEKGFRSKMTWLHTWSGLIVGWLLFAIFVTGTSAYYRNEITLWMQPELHKSIESKKTLDIAIEKGIEASKKSSNVSVNLPNSRSNTIKIMARTSGPTGHNHGPGGHVHTHGGVPHVHGPNGEEIPIENTKQGANKQTAQAGNKKQQQNQKRGRPKPKIYDASTGEELKGRTTAGGNFLYRFHFELYSVPREVGRWIVGIATMFMFTAIITGIIIHKRIFKDLFTFRAKHNPRGWMDAHILPGVATLPFLIMIIYSGLILLTNPIMPWAQKVHFGDNPRAMKQTNNQQNKNTSKAVATQIEVPSLNKDFQRIINANAKRAINKYDNKNAHRIVRANLNRQLTVYEKTRQNTSKEKKKDSNGITKEQILAVLKNAQKIWPNNIGAFTLIKDTSTNTFKIQVNPKDQTSIFSFKRDRESATFDAKTAKLIEQKNVPTTNSIISNTNTALVSLHQAHFADSTLRFIFFVTGILGTVLAGTGLILWTEKRKKKNQDKKSFGFYLVEKLNLGTIMGIFIAIAIYFIANRLIPADASSRNTTEILAFFVAWGAVYFYAFIKDTKKAWKELLIYGVLIYLHLPIINAISSYETISSIYNRDNILIYFDIFFIFTAAVFALVLFILGRREKRLLIGEKK